MEPTIGNTPVSGTDKKAAKKSTAKKKAVKKTVKKVATKSKATPPLKQKPIKPEAKATGNTTGLQEESVAQSSKPQQPAKPPVQQDSLLAQASPDMVINIAIALRDNLFEHGKQTDRGLLHDQIHNPITGLMKRLQDIRSGAGAKTPDFDKIVDSIKIHADSLLQGVTPIDPKIAKGVLPHPPQETKSKSHSGTFIEQKKFNHAAPATPVQVEKPLTPQERLDKQFDMVFKHISDYSARMQCHKNTVDDWCKLNSKNGFIFTFDQEKSLFIGTFLGGELRKEAAFALYLSKA